MASAACCKPAPPAEHRDKGSYGTIGGLKAYINKPAGAQKAVILAADIFGCDTPLTRKLADKTAAAGFCAVVPDYFKGKPFVPEDPANPFANFGPWIAVNHPDASVDATKTIIKELKEQGLKSIGCSGFCWGARLVCMVGKGESPLKAAAILHPSLTTKEDIEDVTIPLAIMGAELDEFTPPSLIGEFKQILDGKPEIPSFVKMYPGQVHGWSIRYDVNVPHQVKGAQEAQEDMLEFYKKHL